MLSLGPSAGLLLWSGSQWAPTRCQAALPRDTHFLHAWDHHAAPLSRQLSLKIRRVCALPSCATRGGGLHQLPSCEDMRCPEWVRCGGEHSPLLNGCCGTAAAGASSQVRLWPTGGSKHQVGDWWSFPSEASLLAGIVLPDEHKHRQLVSLHLHVRRHPPVGRRLASAWRPTYPHLSLFPAGMVGLPESRDAYQGPWRKKKLGGAAQRAGASTSKRHRR